MHAKYSNVLQYIGQYSNTNRIFVHTSVKLLQDQVEICFLMLFHSS